VVLRDVRRVLNFWVRGEGGFWGFEEGFDEEVEKVEGVG